MSTYTSLVTRLRGAADIATDLLHKILYGTPGTEIMYPDPTDNTMAMLSKSTPVGSVWDTPLIPQLLQALADEIDAASGVWMVGNTSGAGVDPVLTETVGVTRLAKDEPLRLLYIYLDPPFASKNWVPHIEATQSGIVPNMVVLHEQAVDRIMFWLADPNGNALVVNDFKIYFSARGPKS